MTASIDADGLEDSEPDFDKLLSRVKADFVESLLQR